MRIPKAPLVKGSWPEGPEGLARRSGPKPSPMRGRWHGGAVTDEVGAVWFYSRNAICAF